MDFMSLARKQVGGDPSGGIFSSIGAQGPVSIPAGMQRPMRGRPDMSSKFSGIMSGLGEPPPGPGYQDTPMAPAPAPTPGYGTGSVFEGLADYAGVFTPERSPQAPRYTGPPAGRRLNKPTDQG